MPAEQISLRVSDQEPDCRQQDADQLLIAVILFPLRSRRFSQHEVDIDYLNLEFVPSLGATLCRLGKCTSQVQGVQHGLSFVRLESNVNPLRQSSPALDQFEQPGADTRGGPSCAH